MTFSKKFQADVLFYLSKRVAETPDSLTRAYLEVISTVVNVFQSSSKDDESAFNKEIIQPLLQTNLSEFLRDPGLEKDIETYMVSDLDDLVKAIQAAQYPPNWPTLESYANSQSGYSGFGGMTTM